MKKYIGNVVVSSVNHIIDECYKKCLSIEEADENLPTIIIGLEKAKDTITDFNILKNKYKNEMLWWTFSKTERRIDYDVKMEEFYIFCINKIISEIEYININIINSSLTSLKETLSVLNNNNLKLYYIDNDKFVFIYDVLCKKIYGLSISTCSFFGINVNELLGDLNKTCMLQIRNFYCIPKNVRRLINNEILSEIVLYQFFSKK